VSHATWYSRQGGAKLHLWLWWSLLQHELATSLAAAWSHRRGAADMPASATLGPSLLLLLLLLLLLPPLLSAWCRTCILP
jgi:hypothetical protein